MNQVDLSKLRDIHLPIEPDFWPLATGWYVLLFLFFILVMLCLILWHNHKNQPLPYALRELEKVRHTKENHLKLLSQLLKRVAMAKYGRKEIAPLAEESWQDFLLSAAPDVFTQKQAHLLAFAMYVPQNLPSDDILYLKAQKWIRIVLKNKSA